MDLQEQWDQARKRTEVIRMRLQDLATFDATAMPYIFLAESSLHQGDTVMRRGQVVIQRPAIVLPNLSPQFEGFEFERDWHVSDEAVATFLLVRGVQFPSLKYQHQHSSLDVLEQSLDQAVEQFKQRLTRAEDITTGLVIGPEAAWQFSVLLMVGTLVIRSAQGDVRRILDDWYRRRRGA
ncbi:MAG: hypothetical protein HY598_00540 [Candidatus Omnitrophica bacterium]|nr:hypothetical protein [Candidatus Omnitrophota bacterium]